jgi:DNA-binding response OmpR family regulator
MAPARPRVLVVEDEPLIALMLEQHIDELGCDCLGPVGVLAQAMEIARNGSFSAAVLNLIIDEKPAYSVAAILAERGIPFGFVSGLPHGAFDDQWLGRPYLNKPYAFDDLRQFILDLLAAGTSPLLQQPETRPEA